MAPNSKLAEETLDQICAWREEGYSLKWISNQLKCQGISLSPSAVGWRCMVLGADLPPSKQRVSTHPPGSTYQRNGRTMRLYTPAEDAYLLELEAKGHTLTHIGRLLGRSKTSVRGRLVTLARNAERLSKKGLGSL